VKTLAILILAACGGHQHTGGGDSSGFACKDRSASYMATKHISGDEIGVLMDCAQGPRIKRWRQDKQGKRDEDVRAISPKEFDHTWDQLNGIGWENIHDCANGSLEKRDPVYVFDIKDDQNKASFQCQTREVPYPYFDITNALDLAANQGRKQLGDDEPADVKALDHEDKQR
jgi:hypothetical protein